MIYKKYQNLFASKMMKDDVNLSSAAVVIVAFRVNIQVTALENRKKSDDPPCYYLYNLFKNRS